MYGFRPATNRSPAESDEKSDGCNQGRNNVGKAELPPQAGRDCDEANEYRQADHGRGGASDQCAHEKSSGNE